ncbi:MAG: DUF951 domain-containing protein [Anaerovoracaceae bacterium]|nr:DUF951 domain-containing protein [Bacillota bacterium]MDY3954945.1 DUF951 domain-containing protein [Anaerovoracaceae bacterium]
MAVRIEKGDIVTLKKNHPCGGNTFEVIRAGMDVRLRCTTCNAQVRLLRSDFEKRIRKVEIPDWAEKR